MTGVGVVEPYRRVYRKQITKKRSTGTNLWAVKPVRKSVTLNPWGMYAAGKKEKKNEPREGRPVGCEARTGSTTGDPWGQVQSSEKKRGSSGSGRWAGEPERGRWYGTSRALNRKPVVNNVQPTYRNTLRGTYAGDQYDASGRQRGTLILSMGPARAVNGTPKVDNV